MEQKILRVGVLNNFNFSDRELEHLEGIQALCPEFKIFVNTNSYPLIRGRFPCVVTVNPTMDKFIKPRGNLSLIKAARIKYIANPTPKVKNAFREAHDWAKAHNIPILITYVRFRSKKTLKKYTTNTNIIYKWKRNFYRQVVKHLFSDPQVYYCDLRDKGCPSCRNCAKLTFGMDTPHIYSINLSSSGSCRYNCPDCFAKCMEKFCKFAYDKISQNSKQKGHKIWKKTI